MIYNRTGEFLMLQQNIIKIANSELKFKVLPRSSDRKKTDLSKIKAGASW